ncbi:MAG TPA: SRPBCC domain-containing protein [Acidimicrobiales bacterium]|nr:SRPBCC domain-containing protein [Acidimicrobiales bacterium]
MATRPLTSDGYTHRLTIGASRRRVFRALTTIEGLTGWWASSATGSAGAGGRFDLGFGGLGETITMQVDRAQPPAVVTWTCLRHSGLPDWDGTTITFELAPEAGGTGLDFRHVGLVPDLECYGQCRAGWERFLSSLRAYTESGRGAPFA